MGAAAKISEHREEPVDEELLAIMDEELLAIMDKLSEIADQAYDMFYTQTVVTYRDVARLQNKLHQIDEKYFQAGFKHGLPRGQAVIAEELEEIHEILRQLVLELREEDQWEDIDPSLVPVIKQLQKILGRLHDLKYHPARISYKNVAKIQGWLHKVDLAFRDLPAGLDEDGTASKMLAKAFATVEEIVDDLLPAEADDVAPKFKKTFKKLSETTELLKKANNLPVRLVSTRYVGSLQSRLATIDDKYREARFDVAGEIPKGQAILADMLDEAHFVARELLCRLDDYENVKLLKDQ
jgi:hypothetical protein